MRPNTTYAVSRIATSLVAAMTLASTVGCSVAAHVSATRSQSAGPASKRSADLASVPIPRKLLRKLPDGVFYILAGPNPASYNLWEVSNVGDEIQLTHNSSGYGISSFDASEAGIVLADASSGVDELARLTPRGPVPLKDGRGSSPGINRRGQIYYIVPPSGRSRSFRLEVKESFKAKSVVAYSSHEDLVGGGWGSRARIALIRGSHAPGTLGSTPELIIVNRKGALRVVRTGLGNELSNVTWEEAAVELAVTSWPGAGEAITLFGVVVSLPAGWHPAAWSPSGSRLLVWGPNSGSIGIWSPKSPAIVMKIGELTKGRNIGQVVWLAAAAKL